MDFFKMHENWQQGKLFIYYYLKRFLQQNALH